MPQEAVGSVEERPPVADEVELIPLGVVDALVGEFPDLGAGRGGEQGRVRRHDHLRTLLGEIRDDPEQRQAGLERQRGLRLVQNPQAHPDRTVGDVPQERLTVRELVERRIVLAGT
jgi:hypothetical protein